MASAGRGLGSKMFLNDPRRSKSGLGACLEAVQPLEHDPERWDPVFSDKNGNRFVQRSCLNKKIEPHSDSIGMEQALAGLVLEHPRQSHPFDHHFDLALVTHHLMAAADVREGGLG